MSQKKIFKIIVIIAVSGIIIGGTIGIYMFNMPQRNVQASNSDYVLTGTQIVNEYLSDKESANIKYLSGDGNSKILEISGMVNKISEDYSDQIVILLKNNNDKAGVSATFTAETNANALALKIGEIVTIKGVIRSGASYDEDLELYEHVVLDKSDVISKGEK